MEIVVMRENCNQSQASVCDTLYINQHKIKAWLCFLHIKVIPLNMQMQKLVSRLSCMHCTCWKYTAFCFAHIFLYQFTMQRGLPMWCWSMYNTGLFTVSEKKDLLSWQKFPLITCIIKSLADRREFFFAEYSTALGATKPQKKCLNLLLYITMHYSFIVNKIRHF